MKLLQDCQLLLRQLFTSSNLFLQELDNSAVCIRNDLPASPSNSGRWGRLCLFDVFQGYQPRRRVLCCHFELHAKSSVCNV